METANSSRNLSKPPVVLLTDFGVQDPYVGIMKGVISTICPGAVILDLQHEIPQGDIQRGAITLHQSCRYFPQEAILIIVIDPGVGTKRNVVVMRENEQYFVGPDNGVLSYISSPESLFWNANDPQYYLNQVSNTFHGRDIFSPVGAHIANGVHPDDLGTRIDSIIQIPKPYFTVSHPDTIRGEVLYADRFGNLVTSIGKLTPESLPKWYLSPWFSEINQSIKIDLPKYRVFLSDGRKLPWVITFGNLTYGECGFLIGSTGALEIVSNNQSAQELLELFPGDRITLEK